MKLIIAKGGLKREIQTPFALCCDIEEMDGLIRALQFARAGMVNSGSSYGWMRIDTDHPCDGPSNTPPLQWNQKPEHS